MVAMMSEFIETEQSAIADTVLSCAMLQPMDVIVFGGSRRASSVTCMVHSVDENNIYVWQHAVASLPLCYPRAWFDGLLEFDNVAHFPAGSAAEDAWDKGLGAWLRKGGR